MKKISFVLIFILAVFYSSIFADLSHAASLNYTDSYIAEPQDSSSLVRPSGIKIAASGKIYIFGDFQGSVDFNISDGTDIKSASTGTDAYLTILNADGSYNKTYLISGDGDEYASMLAIDNSGNVYYGGNFDATVDLDPTSGTNSVTTSDADSDVYLVKLNSDDSFAYAYTWGSTYLDYLSVADFSSDDDIYLGGYISADTDLDPTSGTDTHTTSSIDAYIMKLSSTGSFIYAKTFGESFGGEVVNSLVVDHAGNFYISGYYSSGIATDFDPSGAVNNKDYVCTFQCGYYSKFASNGDYIFTNTFAATTSQVTSLNIDADNNLYAGGYFEGTADFDPSSGTQNVASLGQADAFIAKYSSTGAYLKHYTAGGNKSEYVGTIGVNSDNLVYVIGTMSSQSVDFNRLDSSGIETQPSSDKNSTYILQLDENLNYQNSNLLTGQNSSDNYGISLGYTVTHLAIIRDSLYIVARLYGPVNLNSDGSDLFTPTYDVNYGTLTKFAISYNPRTSSDDEDADDDDDNGKPKPKKCEAQAPPQTTWIKLKPATINDVKGMQVTWTQYNADKIRIAIDDDTDTYPWITDKIANDGHEFLPNVARSQKIMIKPINKCKGGSFSGGVSFDMNRFGWFR